MAWRVLVAESELDLGAIMTKTLCQPAFDLTVCADAESALVSLRRGGPYDTVISDFMLPGMSGLEFVQAIRTNRDLAKLPILMIGDYARFDIESRSMGAGASRFLSKPFTPAQLHAAVTELASRYRPLTPAEQTGANPKATPASTGPMVDPSPSSVIRIPTAEMLAELKRRRPQS